MSAGESPFPLSWTLALAGLASAPVQLVVATEYLSVEGAQKALFPQADAFTEVVLPLSPAQRDEVARLAGPQPPHRSLRVFKAMRRGELAGYVFDHFVDEHVACELTAAHGFEDPQAPVRGLGSGEPRHLITLRGAQRENDFGEGVRLRKKRLLGALHRQIFGGDDELHRRAHQPCQRQRPAQRKRTLARAHVKYECE